MHEPEKRAPSAGCPVLPEAPTAGETEATGEGWEGYSLVVLNDILDP